MSKALNLTEEQFYTDGIEFLERLSKETSSQGIDLEKQVIDHLCYRTESLEEYHQLKSQFSNWGTLLAETMVSGRPIATFKLKRPFLFLGQKIALVELPAPKAHHQKKLGFEHIEIVISENFVELKKKYPHLLWETGGLAKSFNPELEVKFSSGAIKFHHQSLEAVVHVEILAENFLKGEGHEALGVYFINGAQPEVWVICLNEEQKSKWSKKYLDLRFFLASDLTVEERIVETELRVRGEKPFEYRLPQQVNVFVYCQSSEGPRFLLLKRTPRAHHFWQGVTGAPYYGETWEQAAIREVKEETGIQLQHVKPLDFSSNFDMDDRWIKNYRSKTFRIFEQVFYSEISSQQQPLLSDEHEAYKWCSYTEAAGLLKWPNNIAALKKLADHLRPR